MLYKAKGIDWKHLDIGAIQAEGPVLHAPMLYHRAHDCTYYYSRTTQIS
jgi:hypothetical protein